MMHLPIVDLSPLNRHLMIDVQAIDGQPAFCRVRLYKSRQAIIERIGRAAFRALFRTVFPAADISEFKDRRDTTFSFGPFETSDAELRKVGFTIGID